MRKQNVVKSLLICISMLSVLYGQVGTWDRFPAATIVRGILENGSDLLLATDGGVLRFDPSTLSYRQDDLLNQISNLDIRSITTDAYHRIWLGMAAPGDLIQIVDEQAGRIISVGQLQLDAIVDFAAIGDSMFAAYQTGGDGGVIYLRNRQDDIQYLDLYENFPAAAQGLDHLIGVEIIGKRLILISAEEILWANLYTNLKDPANWRVAAPPQFINISTDNYISAAFASGGNLYLAQGRHIYSYDFSTYTEILPALLWSNNISGLDPGLNDSLLVTIDGAIYSLDPSSGSRRTVSSDLVTVSAVAQISDGSIWQGAVPGFLRTDRVPNGQFEPNMPLSRTFSQMLMLQNGNLIGVGKEGVSLLYPQGWRVIRFGSATRQHAADQFDWRTRLADTLEYSRNNVFEDVVLTQDQRLFLSVQGRGVLQLDLNDLASSTRYDTTNQAIEIAAGHNNYMLPRAMAIDSQGNVWITVGFVSEGGQVLTVISPDGTVHHLHQKPDGLSSRLPQSIAIDAYDRVWIGAQVRHNSGDIDSEGGLYLLDFHGTLDNESDDDWAQITNVSVDGLLGRDITQLEIDPSGYLWMRHDAGIQYLPVPARMLTSSELQSFIRTYISEALWELADYSVNRMEVDSRGNKWFMTSMNGVQVLQNNGVWMNGGFGYDTDNSGILSDEIYAAAFDKVSGRAFLSTSKGLSVFQTPFAQPRANYSTVSIYPQPFNPREQAEVYIEGLMDNSSVKIMTVSGKVVRELAPGTGEVQGFEAVWNGRDDAGDLVGSGVYILLYYNEDGKAAVGKLAVIH